MNLKNGNKLSEIRLKKYFTELLAAICYTVDKAKKQNLSTPNQAKKCKILKITYQSVS